MHKIVLICLVFLSLYTPLKAQNLVEFGGNRSLVQEVTLFYIDSSRVANVDEVRKKIEEGKGFKGQLNLDYSRYPVWVAMTLVNHSNSKFITISVENPLIDSAAFYLPSDTLLPSQKTYLGEGYQARANHSTFIRFNFQANIGDTVSVFLAINSTEQLLLPITIETEKGAMASTNTQNLIYGIFIGVILVMFFYNFFIYIVTQDLNYLFYILYIFFIGLGQTALSGHLFAYLFGNWPIIYKSSIVVLPALSGVAAILFIMQFLHSKLYQPKLDNALWVVLVSYVLAALVRMAGWHHISARMMDTIGLPGAFIVFTIAINVYKKGFRSALYFIIAWSVFITGVVLFVLRNLGVLPFTFFTSYTLPLGAAVEVALLSFALADKISTLQHEKRDKEAQLMDQIVENERLVKEQNVILEQKVIERTVELHESNMQLSKALYDLKNTQSQLVEQEKMASLGQLTAGIAHEINNPINFVTSNINPLKRDFAMMISFSAQLEKWVQTEPSLSNRLNELEQLKMDLDYEYLQEEIQFLLKGIDEGAHRTAEIVKGLRIFARNDEDTILNTDLIEGIHSTLIILNNQLGKIQVNKALPEQMFIDCYPGKLNQVFLNLLSNAIYAIHAKYQQEAGGLITISVKEEGEECVICFEDNGIGMDEEVKRKMFEPFFTTKPVGEGTGLGMSIVFKTISRHEGKIHVHSQVGEGTTFEIRLKRALIFK